MSGNNILVIGEKWSVAEKVMAVLAQLEGSRPSKEKNLARVGRYLVTALSGHCYRLAEPDEYDPRYKDRYNPDLLPIKVQQYRFLPMEDKKPLLATIRAAMREATSIIHVGDPDRAGQWLVDIVLKDLGWRGPVQRLMIQDPTEKGIKRSLDEMRSNDEFLNFGLSEKARQIADWDVGMNLSRAYSQAARRGSLASPSLSVGRVQTPLVKLVVDRDRAIEKFRPIPYYLPFIVANHPNGSFKAVWQPSSENDPGVQMVPEGTSQTLRLTDANVANAIAAAARAGSGQIVKYVAEKKREAPMLPFSLLEIQKMASKRFGFGAQKTEDLIQELYAKWDAVTYPRTDCQYLPEAMHAEAGAVLSSIGSLPQYQALVANANPAQKSRAFSDKLMREKSEHGKYALVPTGTLPPMDQISRDAATIYDLIVKAYLSQFYPDREFLSQQVQVSAGGYLFSASGTTTLSPGWKALWAKKPQAAKPAEDGQEDEEEEVESRLPQMQRGDAVAVSNSGNDRANTKAPAYFTEATLLDAMANIHRYVPNPEVRKRLKEGEGLGSEAQRGKMIAKMFDADYFVNRGKTIRSTPKAQGMIDSVNPQVADPGLTAMWEKAFEQVTKGGMTDEQMNAAVRQWVGQQVDIAKGMTIKIRGVEEVKPLPGHGQPCPSCKTGTLVTHLSKSEHQPFLGCSRYNEGCKFVQFPERQVQPLPGHGKPCPKCGRGQMLTKEYKGTRFLGCSNYSKAPGGCDNSEWPESTGRGGGRSSGGRSGGGRKGGGTRARP